MGRIKLEKSLTRIKKFLLDRYKDNLAGILLFGTVNTGEFREGKSDIDTMVFVKEKKELNIDKETKFLIKALKSEGFATQYFHTLKGIVQYIKDRNSFSTYITIVSPSGSTTLYSTPEFEKIREGLRKNPPSKKDIKKFVKKKDEFELDGYFKNIGGFKLTKALFAHLRRKLQILYYFKTGELMFDYGKCLNNLNLLANEREELNSLYQKYFNRRRLNKSEIEKYYRLAKKFTIKITNE